MDLSKYILEETNSINIYGNMLINDTKNEINDETLKFINFFKRGEVNNKIYDFVFFIKLSEKNMEMIMDIPSILNGNLVKDKYNFLMDEQNIILLFMRMKIFIAKSLNGILPNENFIQKIFESKVNKYESFLDRETLLLDKNLDNQQKNLLINKEIKKSRLSLLSLYLILSYYFYKYDYKNEEKLLKFIDIVESLTYEYVESDNLNQNSSFFWKYLINRISVI